MSSADGGVRRAGVGLEVSRTVVRGVVVDDGAPGDVAAREITLGDPADDGAMIAGLVSLHRSLDARERPTRIGWFPAGATLQRMDVTGTSAPDLNMIRHALELERGVTSTMLVEAGARRWLLAMRWNERSASRLQALAAQAGFADVGVEPAPLSVHRVVGDGFTMVRRDCDQELSWAMLRDGDLPAIATTLPAGRREHPVLAVGADPVVLRDEVVDAARLVADIGVAIDSRFGDLATFATVDPELSVVGEPYPPFALHDLRAPHRVAVALGAALGAAGRDGRLRPVGALVATRPDIDIDRRPWTLERIAAVAEDDAAPEPWWRRARSRLLR